LKQLELLQRGLSRFAYSSFGSKERAEGLVLLDFFVPFLISKKGRQQNSINNIDFIMLQFFPLNTRYNHLI